MVELAARLGGGHDAELIEAVTGVRLNDLALDFALGEKACVSETQSLHGGGCVRLPRRARGAAASLSKGARRRTPSRGCSTCAVYREPGHVFGPLRRGADRAGAVIAVGDSREEALERARAAADEIRFVVE